MKWYWSYHRIADPVVAAILAACLWSAPFAGFEPFFNVNAGELRDILSRWLAGCLTLIGLIIATTGFISSLLQTDDFAPLAKSASVSQLWEILRQNLGWLFFSCVFSAAGTFVNVEGIEFLIFAVFGTAILLTVIIALGKLVWVMRSVLFVKISKAPKS